jgi:hypothetical protein
MGAWWVMPAVIGGLMMYGKGKASAAFRWILSDVDSVLSMPVALLLTKVQTGEALPAPPEGFRWKPIDVTFAASPFATPQKLTVNVLEQWLNGVPKPPGVSGFLTSQAMMAAGMHGFVTTQELASKAMEGFLDKENALLAPQMAEVLRREDYLYAPQTAPDFGGYATKEALDASPHHPPHRGGIGDALGELGLVLRRRGLVLAPVGPQRIQRGDYVVSTGNVLYQAIGTGTYREIHPRAGRVGPLRGRFQMAYGVRRA